jgi:predicted esterase
MSTQLKVLYIHSLSSSSKSKKAVHLADHFNLRCVDVKGHDFDHWVKTQQEEIRKLQPDVVVGSSFGGAVAVHMLKKGTWRGPTVLLAQAYVTRDTRDDLDLPEHVPITLIHGKRDNIVEIGASRTLSEYGTKDLVKLIEVDDGHDLETTIETGLLVQAINQVYNDSKELTV